MFSCFFTPVATIVTTTLSPNSGSVTFPNITLASGSIFSDISPALLLMSSRLISSPPFMLKITPFAPSILFSVSGLAKAAFVAFSTFASPVASEMPGYDDEVIMAAGTFVQGASIELSADGPMREPYNVYYQGALTYEHGKLGLVSTLESLAEEGIIAV